MSLIICERLHCQTGDKVVYNSHSKRGFATFIRIGGRLYDVFSRSFVPLSAISLSTMREELDMLGLMQQLGAVPPLGKQ
jgi:hypothetical protein